MFAGKFFDEEIRKEDRSLFNRIHSISRDVEFVTEVSSHFSALPVWLMSHKESVYFKSTDGHFGAWDFNLRRLNWNLVKILSNNKGCIIVDSTRHGKRMPDSLSKTIPIWCCVLNTAIKAKKEAILEKDMIEVKNMPDIQPPPWDCELHILPSLVSKTEKMQIESKIPLFVEKFRNTLPDYDKQLSDLLPKPLRPIWVTPDSRMFLTRTLWLSANSYDSEIDGNLHYLSPQQTEFWDYESLDFIPVLCVCSSMAVPDGRIRSNGFVYIQGSADDHELWAKGLTPDLFWQNRESILNTLDSKSCENIVESIVRNAKNSTPEKIGVDSFNWIGDTNIAVGSRASGQKQTVDTSCEAYTFVKDKCCENCAEIIVKKGCRNIDT
ncbi:hypothetical protein HK096_010654, partial [Nowakowskiella sp. JEL0078]